MFENLRGDQIGRAMYALIQQGFLFSNGAVVGMLSVAEPGTTWAWVGLSGILVLKAVYAVVITLLRPHVDILDTVGEICTAWISVATCICMLALQPWYTEVRALGWWRTSDSGGPPSLYNSARGLRSGP